MTKIPPNHFIITNHLTSSQVIDYCQKLNNFNILDLPGSFGVTPSVFSFSTVSIVIVVCNDYFDITDSSLITDHIILVIALYFVFNLTSIRSSRNASRGVTAMILWGIKKLHSPRETEDVTILWLGSWLFSCIASFICCHLWWLVVPESYQIVEPGHPDIDFFLTTQNTNFSTRHPMMCPIAETSLFPVISPNHTPQSTLLPARRNDQEMMGHAHNLVSIMMSQGPELYCQPRVNG